MYHRLLRKQLRKHLPPDWAEHTELQAFLDSINTSYQAFERDRELMEHAFNLSELEFGEVNQELNSLADQRLLTLKQLNKTIGSLLGSDRPVEDQENIVALSERIRQQVNLNKTTEGELNRNINLFKTLLANLQSGVLVENEHREILFTNELFCTYFKIPATPDQLVGVDCSGSAEQSKHLFRHPEQFVANIEERLRDRKPVYAEVVEMEDGRILERDYVPIFLDGIYRGHLWDYVDVTETVRYQSVLQESEERNRLVMNSSLDAIVIADDRGAIRYWNPRAEKLLGWTKEEAVGQRMTDLFIPHHMGGAHDRGMHRYLETGNSRIMDQVLELSAVNKAGEEFPVELIVVNYQQNGKQYFCGFMKDISLRKRAENLLRAQEEKYRNILANMNLGLLEVDQEGRIQFVNQTFSNMTGYAEAELLGAVADTLEPGIEWRGGTVEQTDNYEVAVRNRRGEPRWWFITRAPNYNDEGLHTGWIGIYLDITDQKQLESELAVAKTKAEEASVAKEAFLANMSHEIRTPLNAIIGMIRELSRESLSDQQQSYLSHTDTAAQHLLSIVNSILDISKIEAGELTLEEHDFSLDAVIANIQSILFIKAESKNIELSCEVNPRVWPAHVGDSARIRQILINLLDNAIKFTLEGSVRLKVDVLVEEADHQLVRIDISDTGIGMEPEYLDQLFSKFTQEEKSTSRRFGGTGLGMSITKEIVRLMDGTIEVRSQKGEGTQFVLEVKLPRGNVEQLSGRTLNNQQLLEGIRILLVEDNLMNRFIAKKSLSHFGCTVDEAENGRLALDRLREQTYDLILMDIQMPELDGVQTTEIIRQELKLDTPIVAVTANAFKKDIDRYLSIGMNDYVTKPFEEEAFLNTLASQLNCPLPVQIQAVAPLEDSYDLTELRVLSRGDEAFVGQMVDLFLQQTPVAIGELTTAIADRDLVTVARTAHRIKPSIDTMGIHQLRGVANEIEAAARVEDADIDKLAARVNFLTQTLDHVVSQLGERQE